MLAKQMFCSPLNPSLYQCAASPIFKTPTKHPEANVAFSTPSPSFSPSALLIAVGTVGAGGDFLTMVDAGRVRLDMRFLRGSIDRARPSAIRRRSVSGFMVAVRDGDGSHCTYGDRRGWRWRSSSDND
jgi:hypothetical protein